MRVIEVAIFTLAVSAARWDGGAESGPGWSAAPTKGTDAVRRGVAPPSRRWIPAFAGMTSKGKSLMKNLTQAMRSTPPIYGRSASGTPMEPSAF
ncbi:hypothetical protein GCM10027159_12470 [Lysobacter terrae]